MSKLSSMDANAIQRVAESVPQNYYKISGKFLILPEMSSADDYRDVASKVVEKAVGFEGNFQLRSNFGKHSTGETISFSLLERETSVGQMKRQISILTGVPADEIQFSFQNLKPLANHITFSEDLNCHGKGGENFWLSRTCTEIKRDD